MTRVKSRKQKLRIAMVWGGKDNAQWMMNHLRSGYFIMNFPDCKNVNKIFEALDRNQSNQYEIAVRSLGKEPLKTNVINGK